MITVFHFLWFGQLSCTFVQDRCKHLTFSGGLGMNPNSYSSVVAVPTCMFRVLSGGRVL